MSGFRFESSLFLNFLWALIVVYFLVKYLAHQNHKSILKYFNPKLAGLLLWSVSSLKRTTKLRLEILVLAFMILAYARPQTSEGKQQVKNEGIEIVFLVDVSNSMMAEDIKPSRLSLAKNELARFVDMSSGDRVSLIAFAGSAVLMSPMTTDQEAIKMYIDSLDPDVVSTQGTNFNKALSEAFAAFERGGLGGQEGSQVTRVVVVASDGEDHEDSAEEELKKISGCRCLCFYTWFWYRAGWRYSCARRSRCTAWV